MEKINNATYTEKEILSMNGVVLEKENSYVQAASLVLHSISKAGAAITLHGEQNGKKVAIAANARSLAYLHEKTSKGKRAYSRAAIQQLVNSETGEVKGAYPFEVHPIREISTEIVFSIPIRKLVPLTEKIFNAFLKGEKWQPMKNIPFVLGTTVVPTKNGEMLVNFGRYNGNSGISVYNSKGVKVPIAAKHLPQSIGGMCAALKAIISSEKLQTAANTEAAKKAILENFKAPTM